MEGKVSAIGLRSARVYWSDSCVDIVFRLFVTVLVDKIRRLLLGALYMPPGTAVILVSTVELLAC